MASFFRSQRVTLPLLAQRPTHRGLLIAPLTLLLLLTLLWPLRVSLTVALALWSILLPLRPGRLLLMLDYRWLWLLLLTLDCRASLLRRDALASPSPLRRV